MLTCLASLTRNLVVLIILLSVAGLAHSEVYTLDVCAVAGGKLGEMGKPVVVEHEGRELRYCCAGCPKTLAKDPQKYLPKVDAMMAEKQSEFYPLDTCPVSKEKLGEDPVEIIYENRLVRFCCNDCAKKFLKGPASYIAMLDEAVKEAQMPDYPLDTCVVAGDALEGDEGVDLVVANRLVRLCCADCAHDFNKNPTKYFADLDAAYLNANAEKNETTGGHTKTVSPHDDSPEGSHSKAETPSDDSDKDGHSH